MKAIDQYFLDQPQPLGACLQALRGYLLYYQPALQERWEYRMPFYYCGAQRLAYLWVHKKYRQPYLGIVDGYRVEAPDLLQEKRARMKILLIDPLGELPLERIGEILGVLLRGKG